MLLQKEHGKDWAVIYGFTEEPQLDGDSNYTIVDGIFQEYRNAKVQFRKHLTYVNDKQPAGNPAG